jgi:hypothetical protein
MNRERIERLAHRYAVRVDGLPDLQAACAVVTAALRRDVAGEGEVYIAAAVDALHKPDPLDAAVDRLLAQSDDSARRAP